MTILETVPLSLVPGPDEQPQADRRRLPWGRILPASIAVALCLAIIAAHALSASGLSLQRTVAPASLR